ncbi:MAG TPA: ABC transporter permease, partial [Candidatus Synoicihabitans sp.]|nr:ABC transporter permease [Candidatus Synoicihabitans sp.]
MLSDLRFAFRQLAKSPGFTIIAVLTLALGIGANTAIFSIINSALLRPLRYHDPDRLVQLANKGSGTRFTVSSGPLYKQWSEHTTTLEGVAGIHDRIAYNLLSEGRAERVTGAEVSANYLSVLGLRPRLGRDFAAGEDVFGADRRVVVLTHEWWQNRFGGDPAILNRPIIFNQQSYTIIGVLPPRALVRDRVNFLVPLVLEEGSWQMDPATQWLEVVARLRPGVSLAQASGEVDSISAELHARTRPGARRIEHELVPMHELLVERSRPTLLMLLGAVAFVLVIACA